MHALHSASMQIHDVLTHQDMVPMAIGVARDAAVSREGRVVCRVAEACMQGLHEAGYNIITVGHSLGAGAAALLAMMLKSRCVTILTSVLTQIWTCHQPFVPIPACRNSR